MRDAAELVRNAGGVVIADEVQAGLGRSGNWWGYEASDFIPDIVTMGKPLGAGVPLAATASSRDYVEKFRLGSGYFNTFASSPLQAAAGNAVLDVFESEQLVRNSAAVGAYLAGQLEAINRDVDQAGDTRHKGLFVAIEWVESRETKQPDRDGAVRVVNELKDRGFLIGNAGAFGNVLKLRPRRIRGRHPYLKCTLIGSLVRMKRYGASRFHRNGSVLFPVLKTLAFTSKVRRTNGLCCEYTDLNTTHYRS